MHIFYACIFFMHHVLYKEHEDAMAFLHLAHVLLHLLQHDVLAYLSMYLCSISVGEMLLAGLGRTEEKHPFQQDGLLHLVHHMGSVHRAEQGQGGVRKLKQQEH